MGLVTARAAVMMRAMKTPTHRSALTTTITITATAGSANPQARPRGRRTGASAVLGAVALAATLATGCDPGGAGDEGEDAIGRELDGTWETACYERAKTTLVYDDLELVGTFTEYEDDACTIPIHVSTWTGTAVISGTADAGATKLDLEFASFESVALTAENAAFNNMYQYCGLTDWAEDVEKDVMGLECYGFSIPEGGESLDIYVVEDDTLRFGQGARVGLELSESDRPSVIDQTRVFTRARG